ncbi:hypothetical protein ACI65C_005213 [Semiaphis heraclei]
MRKRRSRRQQQEDDDDDDEEEENDVKNRLCYYQEYSPHSLLSIWKLGCHQSTIVNNPLFKHFIGHSPQQLL